MSLKSHRPIALLVLIMTGAGFVVGWLSKPSTLPESQQFVANANARPIRLHGYQFIAPLLTYDVDNDLPTPRLSELRLSVEQIIQAQIDEKAINNVAVYFFRDLSTSESVDIGPDLKFAPASLKKIPVLMALYKSAETDPGLLERQISVPNQNGNLNLEIQPSSTLIPGSTVSVEQAIEKMIINSDNNAYDALIKVADFKIYQQSFKDLGIPPETRGDSPTDFLTAKDFSYFLRVLYNATYLNRVYSEKVLQLLSRVDFRDGLVAGVPSEEKVAHKFGINTLGVAENIQERELHDCGLVYHPTNPYLLCVMTKGKSTLSDSTATIQKISEATYKAVSAYVSK